MLGGLPPVAAVVLAFSVLVPVAVAQDAGPARAALMRTATDQDGIRGALDRIARSALDELGVAEVTGTLALDLEQAQLALGCMSVNAECLGSVAEENGVQLLLAPQLDDTGDERVLTVVLLDQRDGSIRQATRRIATDLGNDAILDSVPGLLRELFDLPPLDQADPALSSDGDGVNANDEGPDEADVTSDQRDGPSDERDGSTADGVGAGGPILLGIGGAALVGAVVAGVLASSAEDDYAAVTVTDPATAREAGGLFDQAQTRSRAATALFIGGGLLAAGGLAWLLVDLMGGGEAETSALRLTPQLGLTRAGFEGGLTLEMSL